jgi:hypothetical protein
MELEVAPTDEPDRWHWRIRYGVQPVRDYELHVVDAGKGRYLVDERNSIRLPATLIGGELVSSLAVAGSRLTAVYRRDGEGLEFRIAVTSAEPAGVTGGEGPVPEVSYYEARSLHRAVLRRGE